MTTGRPFRRLLAATTVSTLGDGIYAAALPLIAASLTADPAVIGLIVASPYLAWATLGLVSGVLVDRCPRVLLMVVADVGRVVVVLATAALLATGLLTVPLLVVMGFLLGLGQTVFDTSSQAAVPDLVGSDPVALGTANSRISIAQTVNTEFLGPPLGVALFTLAAAAAVLGNAVSFVLSAVLLAPLLRGPAQRTAVAAPQGRDIARGIGADILSGLRFLVRHRLLLTLTLTTALVNVAFASVETLRVVYAEARLGLGAVGFGLLFAPLAVGGLLGAVLAPPVARRLGAGRALLATLVVLAGALVVLAFASSVPPVIGAMVVAGACIAAYNVLGQTLRQAITPPEVLGRVVAAFRMVALGAVPVGAVLGGFAARIDLSVPYAAGAVLLVATAAVVAPVVRRANLTAARP
ncbi:MFS transporter [Pseudonocardia sp. TRM90224]|uniref:MFS transporter n=1 Tax=Pseudonocardia sp. TRM90224 TaxID=2812678 RepID=UPI001E3CCB61|nr:MFS transporter [Pseudonocardia sp. TRM90224]